MIVRREGLSTCVHNVGQSDPPVSKLSPSSSLCSPLPQCAGDIISCGLASPLDLPLDLPPSICPLDLRKDVAFTL